MRLKLLGYLEQVTQTILLHVTPQVPIPLTFERPVYSAKTGKSIPLTQYIQELSEEMDENTSKMLAMERRKYVDHNIKIESILVGGYRAGKIIEFANNEKVDLILPYLRVLSGLGRIIF